jgi:hypothetical protein
MHLVMELEAGMPTSANVIFAIKAALEAAGIAFLPKDGVGLDESPKSGKRSSD